MPVSDWWSCKVTPPTKAILLFQRAVPSLAVPSPSPDAADYQKVLQKPSAAQSCGKTCEIWSSTRRKTRSSSKILSLWNPNRRENWWKPRVGLSGKMERWNWWQVAIDPDRVGHRHLRVMKDRMSPIRTIKGVNPTTNLSRETRERSMQCLRFAGH